MFSIQAKTRKTHGTTFIRQCRRSTLRYDTINIYWSGAVKAPNLMFILFI